MLKSESLHNHTTLSDGTLTPVEMLEAAERQGIGVMALTDHDTLPDAKELAELRAYNGPVKWFIGVELSFRLPADIGDGKQAFLHMLGHFVDAESKEIRDFMTKLEVGRRERVTRIVQQLNSLGFTITEDECLAFAGGRSVGSPHIVKAFNSHPENVPIMEEFRLRMERDAQNDEDLKVRYDRMMAGGPGQYPYGIFMKQSSYIPMPEEEGKIMVPDLDDAVKLIRDAGGVALLAHWHFAFEHLPMADLEQLIKDKRLDGVETHISNDIGRLDHTAETKQLQELVKRTGCLWSMGSDAHSEGDLATFAKDPLAEGSVGQTQLLIDRVKPDLKFSNF